MAVKLDKIYQDCSHADPQIQTFALMSITRLAPHLVDAPDQIQKILDRLRGLLASKNPDVVFLARKAVNHLEVQFKEYIGGAPAGATVPTRPRTDPGADPARKRPRTDPGSLLDQHDVLPQAKPVAAPPPAAPPAAPVPPVPPVPAVAMDPAPQIVPLDAPMAIEPMLDAPLIDLEDVHATAGDVVPQATPPPPASPTDLPQTPARELDREGILARLSPQQDSVYLASLIISLVAKGRPEDVDRIVPYLRHADDRVRANAVEVVQAHGGPEHVPALVPLLEDRANRVVGNACMALAQFENPAVPRRLLVMLRSNLVSMRETAAFVLTTLDNDYAEPLLVLAARDPYEAVRLRAIKRLALWLTRDSVNALKNALNDMDIDVCEAAAESLRQIKTTLQARKAAEAAGQPAGSAFAGPPMPRRSAPPAPVAAAAPPPPSPKPAEPPASAAPPPKPAASPSPSPSSPTPPLATAPLATAPLATPPPATPPPATAPLATPPPATPTLATPTPTPTATATPPPAATTSPPPPPPSTPSAPLQPSAVAHVDETEPDAPPAPAPAPKPEGDLLSLAYKDLGETVYHLCRNNMITNELLDGLFYEILRYQDFLRAYQSKQSKVQDASQQAAIEKLQEKIRTAMIGLGRQAASLFKDGQVPIPDKEKAAVTAILDRVKKARRATTGQS